MNQPSSILVVRFSAMGDILHALPAVISLKRSFPRARVSWIVRPQWIPLLEGNPYIDEIVPFRRGDGLSALISSLRRIRKCRPDLAIDFQGLIQSALTGRIAGPRTFWGFDRSTVREALASRLYTHRSKPSALHRIDMNLELAQSAGASELTNESWIPPGSAEGELPGGPFVLASPFAGWGSKQWPIEHYRELGCLLERERVQLVLNVASKQAPGLEGLRLHLSSLAGLINATRRASAVVGIDSGPMHLAAALRKPGVAIFGPTDPISHGPYGDSLGVIRKTGYATTYKRETEIHPAMRAVTPVEVFQKLLPLLAASEASATAAVESTQGPLAK